MSLRGGGGELKIRAEIKTKNKKKKLVICFSKSLSCAIHNVY